MAEKEADIFCGTCFWWEEWTHDHGQKENVGYCRRNAPAPFGANGDISVVEWPVTRKSDWCGEWDDGDAPDD